MRMRTAQPTNVLDVERELQRRDVGMAELARASGLSRATVKRLVDGRSAGRPSTRRVLRAALAKFPVIEEAAG